MTLKKSGRPFKLVDSPLRNLRLSRGFTIDYVCRRLGTVSATVYNWESGTHNLPKSKRRLLADLYSVTLAELNKVLELTRNSAKK